MERGVATDEVTALWMQRCLEYVASKAFKWFYARGVNVKFTPCIEIYFFTYSCFCRTSTHKD
jgi:hypothetical protein